MNAMKRTVHELSYWRQRRCEAATSSLAVREMLSSIITLMEFGRKYSQKKVMLKVTIDAKPEPRTSRNTYDGFADELLIYVAK